MKTMHDGVTFYENKVSQGVEIKKIAVEVSQPLSGKLVTLDDVKSALAKQVKACGGNTLMSFEYGQRQKSWWQVLLLQDEVAWYGSGVVLRI
jgi:hypothetical protein